MTASTKRFWEEAEANAHNVLSSGLITSEQIAREYGYVVNLWGRTWFVVSPRDFARSKTQGKYAKRWFASEQEAWDGAAERIRVAKTTRRKKV